MRTRETPRVSGALTLQPRQQIGFSVGDRIAKTHQSSLGGGPPWRQWREGAGTRGAHSTVLKAGVSASQWERSAA